MNELLKKLSEGQKKKLSRKKQPQWFDPMLTKLTQDYFSKSDWIYERKLDGDRCLAFVSEGKVRLISRNRMILNHACPEIVQLIKKQDSRNFIADGEIVAIEGNRMSFSRLQSRMHAPSPDMKIAVYYYLFDLMSLDGCDLRELPPKFRKNILKSAFDFEERLCLTTHCIEEGEKSFKKACRKKREGVIAKNADSSYVSGRSESWPKFKCVNRQEFVIGGYTDPQGSRTGFGALLIGYFEGKNLIYAGKVGTGFDEKMLETISGRLAGLGRKTSPFSSTGIEKKWVHWINPALAGEVGFTEWTSEGRLRHPRFLGLRRDKSPEKVVKETDG